MEAKKFDYIPEDCAGEGRDGEPQSEVEPKDLVQLAPIHAVGEHTLDDHSLNKEPNHEEQDRERPEPCYKVKHEIPEATRCRYTDDERLSVQPV